MAVAADKNRVMETSATTGTGTLTLAGAVTGYQTFAAVGDGNTVRFCTFACDSGGTPTGDWEVASGAYTSAGTTLARTTIHASSNSGSAVNFTSGSLRVMVAYTAEDGLVNNAQCQGRLTLTTGVAVPTADVTASTSVYFTPYQGNRVALFNGSTWQSYQFTELTLALGVLTADLNYDVFLYDNAGTLTLESLAWTDATNRATAIALQNGVYVKSGATTRRYLGTFRTVSTTQTADSGGGTTTQVGGKRFLWNYYNQVARHLSVIDTTNTWSYTTDTWRQAGGIAGNKVEVLVGLAGYMIEATAIVSTGIVGQSTVAAKVGIGVDSTTSPSGLRNGAFNANAGFDARPVNASYVGYVPLGYHYYAWLEKGGDTNCIFYGDNAGDGIQSGLTGIVWG